MEKLKNQPCISKEGLIESIRKICKYHNYDLGPFMEAIRENELGWFSRSCAVMACVFKKTNNEIYALVEQRGKGSADFHYAWCCPCGYVEFGMTAQEAISAEALQECGFRMDPKRLVPMGVNSLPTENRQNITIRYAYEANEDEDFDLTKAVGGEEDEVNDVQWIKIGKVENNKFVPLAEAFSEREWAFGHEKLLVLMAKKMFNE